MRLLLDTHALIWWFATDPGLPAVVRAAIEDEANAVYVSAASAWEIATKHRIGKLPHVGALVADLEGYLPQQGFVELPVSVRHGRRAGDLPGPHRDPFDRMLIAQAIEADLILVSNETVFDKYGVKRCGSRQAAPVGQAAFCRCFIIACSIRWHSGQSRAKS